MTDLDRLILAIYKIVSRDDELASMLGALAGHFSCKSAVLAYVHPRRPETNISIAHGPLDNPDVQTRYARDFAALDPAPSAFGLLRVGHAANTDVLFADTMPLYHRFLHDFYHPLGLRAALGGPIANEDGQIGLFAVHRGPDRAPFADDEVRTMEVLLPHISNAVDLRRRFFALEQQRDARDDAFEPLGFGLMLFEDGRLTDANRTARTILARADGLALDRDGGLTSPDEAIAARLSAMLRSGANEVAAVKRSGGVYGIRAYSLNGARAGGRRTVLICDADTSQPVASHLIRDIYAVPPQCAQLIESLLSGKSLEEHAALAGISRNTAKFHLRAAFEATGTRRQIDLIRQVAPLIAALSSGPDA